MKNPFTLQGKKILITGASSGIGRASAIECAKMGAACIITGRDEIRLKNVLDELDGSGHIMVMADLKEEGDLQNLIEQMPVLDGLVNNAGISMTKPIGFIKKEEITDVFQTNTFVPILLTQALLKKRKLNKGASIVFTSSMASYNPEMGNSIYGASKGAVTTFVRACAKELSSRMIRVNAVHPGMVNTPLVERLNFTVEQLEADKQRYPLKRYAEAEEIAYGIIYLLSDASSMVTGTSLMIDGGIHLV